MLISDVRWRVQLAERSQQPQNHGGVQWRREADYVKGSASRATAAAHAHDMTHKPRCHRTYRAVTMTMHDVKGNTSRHASPKKAYLGFGV